MITSSVSRGVQRWAIGLQCEVDAVVFLVVADLEEDGGGEPQQRSLVRDERGDAGFAV
jgi:hypothetical protein